MTGGNPQGLARAECELGLRSWSVSFRESPFGYAADEILWPEGTSRAVREARRWSLLWRAIREFDVIHFNFGRSLLPYWSSAPGSPSGPLQAAYRLYARLFELRDLPLLARAGKGLAVTFQGDDARQGDFVASTLSVNAAAEVETGYYAHASDERKRWRIRMFDKHADRIYALNPDLLRVLPKRAQFLPYAHIDLREWRPVTHREKPSRTPVVVHAPTHRGVKGTRHVLDAVSNMKKQGLRFEFRLLEGITHDRVREEIEQADLVVDQLLVGWYGGIAVEAMALGKPVVSYVREEDLLFVPEEMRNEIPVVNATPSTVESVLTECLTKGRRRLPELGQSSRAYVEKWHDPLVVAARLKRDYEAIMSRNKERRA
jgi:hypothetical protein